MLELAFPWALALAPLPLLIWFILPAIKTHFTRGLNVPFYAAMAHLIQSQSTSISTGRQLFLPACIWLLLVLALAGPRYIGEPLALERQGYNIMLALDLSESMQISDMIQNGRPVSRLAVVKQAAEEFVKSRSTDKIGLILFGEKAYLQTPLTWDRNNILMRIEDATAGLAGKTTSIGDAIGLAVKRFQNVKSKERIIILLTDGTNTSGILKPLKAAELARDEKIKIYTIGLGADANPLLLSGGFIIPNASADLDEKTLKEIADLTKGQYFRATDPQSLHAIYKTIDALETVQQEARPIRPEKEYYPWILALALCLFMYWIVKESGWPRKNPKERMV